MNGAMAGPKRVIPVYLEPEQIEWLETMAEQHERTKGYFVRQAVAEQMEKCGAVKVGVEAAR